DGYDGLTRAAANPPDLILLDVDLPGMDGFEVCTQLKANPKTMDIPVVFLTGAATTEEKLRGLELGAADYVIKPFDPAELRARVHTSLNTKRLMDLLAQKALVLQESEERFRVLAENSSDVISRQSPKGHFLYVSPASEAILGYTPEQMLGRHTSEFVHPDDFPAVAARFTGEINSGHTEFRFRRPDGSWVWLETTWRALHDPLTGAFTEIHASARNIDGRKEMEFREEVRADVLQMIAQGRPLNDILKRLIVAAEIQEPTASAVGIMLNEGVLHHYAPNLPQDIVSLAERQMYTLIDRFSQIAAGGTDRVIICDIHGDDAWKDLRPALAEHGVKSCWSILIRSRQREAAGAFTIYRRDYDRPRASTSELLKMSSELTSVAVEHRQLSDQLKFQAQHDALTQLPNRALFQDRLEQAMALSRRTGRAAAALLIDVDRFKHINDTYGHQAGDELLCQVAHRIRSRLRTSDSLARMGGDEFAVILSELVDPKDAELVANSLVEEFKRPVDLRGLKLIVTLSIGAAVYPECGLDSATLLKNADLALYRAKDAGRNAARSFTPDMSEHAVERMELENSLSQAIENNQLRLHYQLKVDASGSTVGLEALVRWQHPTLGLVPPGKFITIAEDSGLIVPIGKWVLHEAARQYRAWADHGLPVVPISVNVSTLQFSQPQFMLSVSEAIQIAGQQGAIGIELTESLLMRNMRDAEDKLLRLKHLKVEVAIDDFGTGYSSLAYLQRLSIDTLKIDHSFVRSIDSETNGRSSRIIVGATVALAKSLGIKVVAEGVETVSQREFLLGIGCDMLQGYLFSRPQDAEQTALLLRTLTTPIAPPLRLSA
ncbi:MAG: hypothetical protein JWM57_2412, partial [Phycisphaerales bacterium]|nr:hypothetical protein [Phycisphaerales bacterium]